MIAALGLNGELDLVGLAGIITAMSAFMLKMQRDERNERDVMRKMFIEERRARDTDMVRALEQNRREVEAFLGNHLSYITKALERVVQQLDALEAEARRAHEQAIMRRGSS